MNTHSLNVRGVTTIPVESIQHLYGNEDRQSHGHWMEIIKHFTRKTLKHRVVLSTLKVMTLNAKCTNESVEFGKINVVTYSTIYHEHELCFLLQIQMTTPYQLIERHVWTISGVHKPP